MCVWVTLPESKAETVVLQFQFQIISDFKMATKAKTLVTKGKTLVSKGKALVIEGKTLVPKGKTLVPKGRS